MALTVLWGRDRFQFELPPENTVLSAIRQSIAAYTQLAYDGFQMVHDGAVMNDDNAPISAYSLRPNSSIAIIAAADLPTDLHATSSNEHALIALIQSELSAARRSLIPAQSAFLRDLEQGTQPRQKLSKEHSRIGELLLQALLRLDGIAPEQDWLAARADRKAAVKELQSVLDELDNAWGFNQLNTVDTTVL